MGVTGNAMWYYVSQYYRLNQWLFGSSDISKYIEQADVDR